MMKTMADQTKEVQQLCANARENATHDEFKRIDRIERRGWHVTVQDLNRLQAIADR